MPNIDKQKSQANKKRLGRGLGSLLSTNMHDFDESSEEAKAPAKAELKTEKKPIIETKPATPSQQPAKTPLATKTESGPRTSPVPTIAKENSGLDYKLRIWSLPIDKVKPNKTQPRKDFIKEPLQELANSIKEQGLLQPITVRRVGEEYEIIAGERRWRASQLAGVHEIPAIIKEVMIKNPWSWLLLKIFKEKISIQWKKPWPTSFLLMITTYLNKRLLKK